MIPLLRLSCLLLAGLAALPAAAQMRNDSRPPAPAALGERELTVQNRSRRVINEIYVSPTAADNWGEDRLNDGVLAPGGSLRVRLGRLRDCAFDIQVIYDDGAREESSGHNACRTRQLAFDGSRAVARPLPLLPENKVTVQNNSLRAIQQVFVSPPDAQQWGDDVLADSLIPVGGEAEIVFRGACTADLRVVFDNRAAEERRGLDLCARAALSIEPGWTTQPEVPALRTPQPQRGDAPAAGHRVRVSNRAGSSLVELYVFDEDAAEPGEDLLGGRVLADGAEATVQVPGQPGPPVCRFRGRAVLEGARPDVALPGLDLCAAAAITILR